MLSFKPTSLILLFVLLAPRSFAKRVDISFDASVVSFFAPVGDADPGATGEPWSFASSKETETICASSGAGSAVTRVAGAGFDFEFNGTAISLITGPANAYSISIDGGKPTEVRPPSAKRGLGSNPAETVSHPETRAPVCGATFTSPELQPGTHKVHVTARDTSDSGQVDLVFVRAVIDDGGLPTPLPNVITSPGRDQPQTPESQVAEVPATMLEVGSSSTERKKRIGIAVGCTIGGIVLLSVLLFFFLRTWRRHRAKAGLMSGFVDLEKPNAGVQPKLREVQGRENTPNWLVHSLTKKNPVDITAPPAMTRGRRNSARSSWTSFGATSPGNLGPSRGHAGIGTNSSAASSVVTLDDTLTLLRPPIPKKPRKDKKPRHPFRVPTLHPTRPKAGCPTLQVVV